MPIMCNTEMRANFNFDVHEQLGLVVLNERSRPDQTGNMTYFSSIKPNTVDLAWTNSFGLNFLENLSISIIGMSDRLPISKNCLRISRI